MISVLEVWTIELKQIVYFVSFTQYFIAFWCLFHEKDLLYESLHNIIIKVAESKTVNDSFFELAFDLSHWHLIGSLRLSFCLHVKYTVE